MRYSVGVEDFLCPLILLGLLFTPIIIIFNRLEKVESDHEKQQKRWLDLEQRLANLESGATHEKTEKSKPEETDLPPILEPQKPSVGVPSVMQSPKEPKTSKGPLVVSKKAWEYPQKTESSSDPIPEEEPSSPTTEIEEKTVPQPPVPEIVSAQKQGEPQSSTPLPAPLSPEPTPKQPEEKTSFELQLGKVWFVRIGVVMVLTGLAYLAHMGYKGLAIEIRPYLNASLLYLISFAMMSAGLFLHRRFEFLKNYSEVLTGGGMAAVYFSTYALFFVDAPVLGLIKSPIIAGQLLAAWAVFIIWFASRKKSEVMALFAVAGAYYASYVPLIHEPDQSDVIFTFASNAALALTTLFFLIKNRWANLSFLALLTSYGGFAYWRFRHAVGDSMDFWQDATFLGIYWLIFTAAGFLSRNDQLDAAKRATFVNLNNGAFFGLMTIVMLQVPELRSDYWMLPLIFSGITLGLYFAATKLLPSEKLFGEIMLGKSALLATLAIMTYKDVGEYRALLLAAESVMILFFGLRTKNRLLHGASAIIASIGVVFVLQIFIDTVKDTHWHYYAPTLRLGIFFSLLMLGAGVIAEKFKDDYDKKNPLQALPSFFTVIGFLTGLGTCCVTAIEDHPAITGLALTCFGLAALAVSRVIRIGAVFIFSKVYMISGFLLWLWVAFNKSNAMDYWQAPLMLVFAAIAQQLHQRYENTDDPQPGLWTEFNNNVAEIIYTGFMGVITVAWILRLLDFEFLNFPLTLTGVGIAFIVYAYSLRSPHSYALSQVMLFFSVCLVSLQLIMPVNNHIWGVSLIPAVIALGMGALLQHKPDILTDRLHTRETDIKLNSGVMQIAANLCGLVVALKFIPEEYKLWVLPLIGVALSVAYLQIKLIPSIIAVQAFIITSALMAPLKLFVPQPEMWSTLFPVVVMLGMSHFLMASSELIKDEKHPLRKLGKGGTQLYFFYGWTLCLVWGIKFVPENFLFLVFTVVSIAHGLAHQRRERNERLIVAGAFLLAGIIGFWIHAALNWDSPRLADGLALTILLGVHTAWRKITRDNQIQPEVNLAVIILINLSLWVWTSSVIPGDWDIIGWGALAFVLIGLGLWTLERVHRLFGLVILLTSISNLVFIAYSKLDGSIRILTFMGMGVILIILGGLYHKYQEKLKELL
ncbi:MAG: DUF2339 domain-containing protein [Verrucomicrobiota bacterium]|nr:DUF2339 domain-containing protein [Verrucomicrobiota bacterium]